MSDHDKLAEAISHLACAVRESTEQRKQDCVTSQQLEEVFHKLTQVLASKHDLTAMEEKIMAKEQDVLDALAKIDAATTKIGATVEEEADVIQTVSDEVDALVTALQNAGVSQTLVDQATALADKAQASSDSLDTLVPVLKAIAAKGVTNPVPVPVP